MAANSKPKPRAIRVVLSPETEAEREIELREPQASEYLRLMAAQTAVVRFHSGDELTDADEAHIRQAICLLSVDPAGERLSEDDVLALSQADWARLFLGLMQIMTEANASPLATTTKRASKSSSSALPAASLAASPSGQRA